MNLRSWRAEEPSGLFSGMEERPSETILQEDEEICDLLRWGYRIIQKKNGFRFGIDAVLLAWFAGTVGPEDRVIDLGSGTGVIPLLMDARNDGGSYLGLEIDPRMTEMASRSALLNGCEGRVHFVTGDLREASERFGKSTFDIVTANPPYRKTGTGKLSPDPMKAAARHEVLCTLEDVVREAAALLTEGGRFYMIHRAERFPEILSELGKHGLKVEKVRAVCPSEEKMANLMLIGAVKGEGTVPESEEPLFVYDKEGHYTQEILDIYRE